MPERRLVVVMTACAGIVLAAALSVSAQDRDQDQAAAPVDAASAAARGVGLQGAYSGASTELGGRLDAADAADAPRTPWGHPDLRGVWNNSTTTPLERLTDGEQERSRVARESVQRATGGTGAGWLEQAGGLERESLIVDPPDGRIPTLRPEAIRRLIDRENARAGRGDGPIHVQPHRRGSGGLLPAGVRSPTGPLW